MNISFGLMILVIVERLHYFNDTSHFVILQSREKHEKDERRRRTLANAVKQARAAQWIKDNIIANQVNKFKSVIGCVMTAFFLSPVQFV